MPMEQVSYLQHPVVHPLCQSGNHDMCKKYEDWNFKAEFPCACDECNHPSPLDEQDNEVEEEPSCPEHPNYGVIRAPRRDCKWCWRAYFLKHPEKAAKHKERKG